MALPGTLTVEELFAPPQRARASISPDGTRIAYLAPWQGRLNVWAQGVGPRPRHTTSPLTRTAVEALRARGAEVEYVVFDDEGHMFVSPENVIAMFRAAERFLAQHLGARQ
ncbi:alpha/beta hydrolase family protein [Streptomyces acidicola]|uniref:alpha/beta hydrolase family protein n=1 Tax=Streptomyces acidicola TaxID=2596892 RepID=UPI001D153738|nr:hypothetical protein [Streptomyces acidicola]